MRPSPTWIALALPLGLLLTLLGSSDAPPPRAWTLPEVVRSSDALTAEIDGYLADRWAEEGIEPAAEVDDLAFARRLWLDLLGTIPSLEEIRMIEGWPAEGRQARLVDYALKDPRFREAFAERLARIVVGGDAKPDDLLYRRRRLVSWLTRQIAERRPWDELVRELITADGLSTSAPATNFIVSRDADPIELAARSTRAFLGIRIDCAQCHDHPFNDWRQAEFEGLAAYWARVERNLAGVHDGDEGELTFEVPGAGPADGDEAARAPPAADPAGDSEGAMTPAAGDPAEGEGVGDPAEGEGEGVASPRGVGADLPGRPGPGERVVYPGVPFGAEWLPEAPETRRDAYAAWITHPENDYFARAITNRIWAWLLGSGFVEPLDELDVSVPWEGELLALLAEDLVAHGFQLERLVRAIVSSRAYALDSAAPPGVDEGDAADLWAVYALKPLRAGALGRAVFQSTSFWTYDRSRATLVRFGHFANLNDFEKRQGEDPDAERVTEESLLQRLHLLNGKQYHERAKDDDAFGPVARLPMLAPTDEAAVEGAFLMTLTRRPTAREAAPFLERLAEAGDAQEARAAVIGDLCWALVNTTEFRLNH